MLQLANAAEASYAEPDAGEAFDRFVRMVADAYARNRMLVDAMTRCEVTPEVDTLVEGRRTVAASRAGRRRRAHGRPTAEDVFGLIPAASSYPEIVLDGLRAPQHARPRPTAEIQAGPESRTPVLRAHVWCQARDVACPGVAPSAPAQATRPTLLARATEWRA